MILCSLARALGGHTLFMTESLTVPCHGCGYVNQGPQPYRYHAGFGDTAFLYNEAGDCTLIWGVYDHAYERILGGDNAWRPSHAHQRQMKSLLPPSPRGDRWCFSAPARCGQCRAAIAAPMAAGEIYYLEYPGSVVLGRAGLPSHLESILITRAST